MTFRARKGPDFHWDKLRGERVIVRQINTMFRTKKRPGSGAGFTLFEIMVSVAILSIGLVVILEALLVCLNIFGYSLNYLNAQCWMNEKMWRMEDYLARTEGEEAGVTTGKFRSGNKKIAWTMSITPIIEGSLYELSLVCSWKEGSRSITVSRIAYAGI